ncbi:MAG TPA: chemotaxis protein [Desulfovibrio sp.]|nr:chemotaxis protein [Desulfovibrio sp.]
MTIRAKLILSFLAAIVVAIGSISLLVSYQVRSYAEKDFKESSLGQLKRVNEFLVTFFSESEHGVAYISSLSAMKVAKGTVPSYVNESSSKVVRYGEMSEAAKRAYEVLAPLKKTNPYYDETFVAFDDGGFLAGSEMQMPAGYDPRKRGWYQAAVSGDGIQMTDAYKSTTGEAVTSAVGRIVDASGRTIGAAGIDINLSTLTKVIANIRIGETGYVVLIEDSGVVLSDSKDPANLFKKVTEIQDNLFRDAFAMREGVFEAKLGGKERLVSVLTGFEGWKLVVIIDTDEIFAESRAIVLKIVGVGAVIALILVVCAWFISRTIANPIDLLVRASGDIAAGNFDALPESSRFSGELLTLHGSLKRMVESLGELIKTAEAKSQEAEQQTALAKTALEEAEEARKAAEQAKRNGMLQAARDLQGIVEVISAASEELAAQIEQASRGAEFQSQRTGETATAMEEMNATVLEVARSAGSAAETSANARDNAEVGAGIVRDMVKGINSVNQYAERLQQDMDVLGRRAEDIGRIINVINDIADQTNLLALNAAIEAARAGEAGRGFAVVADEVRKLAEKTMAATKEVSDAIGGIQSGTRESFEQVQQTVKEVVTVTTMAEKAGNSLATIVQLSDKSSDQVRSIATASEEQSAASEEIAHAVDEINRITAETSDAMRQSAQAVTELAEQAQRLKNIIETMQRDNA